VAELTLASYNILLGNEPRRRRPFDVVAACARLDTDVLVLQECSRLDGAPGIAADVGAALGYAVVESPVMKRGVSNAKRRAQPKVDHEPDSDVYTAVLSRLPILDERVTPLPRLRIDHMDRFVVTIDVDVSGAPVTIASTHLPHLERGSPWLRRPLRAALPPSDRAAVLAGDMNMWGWCIDRMVDRGWRRAVRGRTWPASHPHSGIDHVLVTNAIEVLAGEVVPLVRSDHRPVRVRLGVDVAA
jgi:endonuclease/exonuclease/phosphatase family metal-dependent hydrolase